MNPKIIIIPGNGNTHVKTDNWFSWLTKELEKREFTVICQDMPDPDLARKDIWLPHIKNELKADKNSIIIGHSSGAVAAMRYLETNKLLGAVLVGACHTDLGYESEKASGYYDDPWQWNKIRTNAGWIVQFASQDDPYISIQESRYIHQQLDCEYHEYTDQGHFSDGDEQKYNTFPQLIEIVQRKTSK